MAETTDDRPEVWLPISGMDYAYEVSNHGRVRNSETGLIMKDANHRGYRHVSLICGGKGKTKFIHRLVLEVFCGPPHSTSHQACHNNGLRDDNRLTNLRWGTAKENAADREIHGTQRFGTTQRCAKLDEDTVIDMRNQYRNGKSTYAMARDMKLSTNTVWSAVVGKTWKHVEGAINNVG